MFVKKKIKAEIKKKFASHIEKLEESVAKFLMQKDFDGLQYSEFRKSLANIDAKLNDYEDNNRLSIAESYYELKKTKASFEELKPKISHFEEIMNACKEIGVPIKFESTPNSFMVRLVDFKLLEALEQSINFQNTKIDQKLNSKINTSPPKYEIFDQVIDQNELQRRNSSNSMSEKFNSSNFNSIRKILPGLAQTTLDSQIDPYNMKRSALVSSSQKNLFTNFRSRIVEQPYQTDINLNDCQNIYETDIRSSHQTSIKAKKPINDRKTSNSEYEQETPLLELKKMKTTTSEKNLFFKAFNFPMSNKKPTYSDAKKFPKYYSSVITLNEDSGVICNQIIDETKFKTVLSSLKSIPKNIRVIEMVNNVFKCNPIPMLRSAFDARLSYLLKIDISKNQMMANLIYTKRDLEFLTTMNIALYN